MLGCAAPSDNASPPSTTTLPIAGAPNAVAPRFTFAPGDEFDLRVPDAPQFDQTVRVRPDGKISLPLVGTLPVQGRTPEDVEDELHERFVQLAGAPGARDYLLQAGDDIEIKFPYQPALNEILKLRPDGKLQLQMIGVVQAEGLSPEELQQQLKTRYARYLRSPELTVIVRNTMTQNVRVAGISGMNGGTGRAGMARLKPAVIARSAQTPQVFVGGEVGHPGVLAYRPGLTLLQALVEAGGELPSGDATQLVLLRRGADGAAQSIKPGLPAAYLQRPDREVPLQPFDVVLLPKSDAASLADRLNLYLYNLLPPLKNSSLGFSYVLGGATVIK